MPLDASELIIGPAFMTIDGTDMGFTNADGITYSPEWEVTEFESSQTQMVVAAHRHKVRAVLSATFAQLSLAKWRILEDIKDAPVGNTLVGSWDMCGPTERIITLTMAAPGCGVRTMQATGIIITPGEKVFSNGEYSGAPVEILLLGNAEDESLWTMIETPSSVTVPAVQTYAAIAANGTETAFVNGATTVSKDAVAVQVNFNVPIRPDQYSSSKFVLTKSTGETVPATYAPGQTTGATDYAKVKVIPTGGLTATTTYTLVVVTGVTSTTGKRGAGTSVVFTTTA